MECIDGHYWVENSGLGGEPRFVENRHLSGEPVMHVRCRECGARTWFTEKQWLKYWLHGDLSNDFFVKRHETKPEHCNRCGLSYGHAPWCHDE